MGDRPKSHHGKRQSASSKSGEANGKSSRVAVLEEITLSEAPTPRAPKSERRHTTPRSENHPVLNVLIIGARNCGKTSFIKNTLDPDSNLSGRATFSTKVKITDQVYKIRYVELEIDDVDFSSDKKIIWPPSVNGEPFPDIDAVFCVYDASDRDSVAAVPTALTSMTKTGIRCMLVASKCDKPESQEIRARFHEQVRRNLATIAVAEVSVKTPETTKRHFFAMLHRVIASPKASESRKSTVQSRRTKSRTTSPRQGRSRSRSKTRLRISKSKELLLNLSNRSVVVDSASEDTAVSSEEDTTQNRHQKTRLRLNTTKLPEPSRRSNAPHTPDSSEEQTSRLLSPIHSAAATVPETPDSYYVKSILRSLSTETTDSRANQTFLNMDDENEHGVDKEFGTDTDTLTPSVATDETVKPLETGVPFRELVDKLLILPASKNDSKFVPSFLCLYRVFATPQRLLGAVIDQFVEVDKSTMVHFTKVAEMLRFLQVLAQWTATYPGDFASGPARTAAISFIQSIETSKVFAPAAREISNNLNTLVADEDADWAYDEGAKGLKSSGQKTPQNSSGSLPRLDGHTTSKGRPRSGADLDESDEDADEANSSTRGSGAASASSSMLKSYQSSSQSYTNLMQLESAKAQAQRYKPIPHLRLAKFHWHYFMEVSVDDLAREITRVDWAMYSAIRPRDFVRHVVLTTEQKRRSRQVDNIGMMVKQFNHLALFVSGMILLRDKPKHRAKALEKFMLLASKVRQLNNYNSLGAIVAGINGHEISRLTQTRELVTVETQKTFMSLTILMGIARSHVAYRMAWANSFTERIPFIPLVRQDLTMAASANQTFIGTNINWKKFEIMGDVIVGVQRSLETPYSFPQRTYASEEIIKLILETKIVEESEDSADPRSELYDRSVQVEPTGADPRKKFDWLRR
ncbi:hypothetical protein B0A52_07216 [Exophiala mesophila]|uniref:Ras-GEF domain-containing protein n=1 Tax=Exophiala mesophila TaxID=212818 RepID=A0A438N0K8_EXOME|nr:hypothetical protein B0A52_07216 [Exophiala mesophila]